MKSLSAIVLFISLSALARSAQAWEDHSIPTALALQNVTEVNRAEPVKVETFDSFVEAEKAGLAKVTDDEETWAFAAMKSYAPRPEGLQFRADAPTGLRESFLKSLRLNPTIKLGLYVQRLPGLPAPALETLPCHDVTILSGCPGTGPESFGALHAGDTVAAKDVVATAADEPDYGHDIGLWEDNSTAFGKTYGFGKQPFGNPSYEISSQAPFHIGYYHEAGIVFKAASFLKRTYPEMRIHQFLSLAQFAFKTGHPYWGWRFLGWGLHYIQDLTQPFHSTVLPGVSVPDMLLINTIDLLGVHAPKSNKVNLVTNRHFAIENFELETLKFECARDRDHGHPVLQALEDTSHDLPGDYEDTDPRELISKRSHAMAGATVKALKASLPKQLVSDPSYEFGVVKPVPNTHDLIEAGDNGARERMTDLLAKLMREFGVQTRRYLRAGLR